MAQRAGTANLPLHDGRVPRWLADRMTRLGAVISAAIVHHYGSDELLRRLAHPFWFQSFGAVMGMDWHSSGITTSVIGALLPGPLPKVMEVPQITPLSLSWSGERMKALFLGHFAASVAPAYSLRSRPRWETSIFDDESDEEVLPRF